MKRLFLDILRMIFHNEFECGCSNFYKQRKQLWKHQHLNVSRFWINVQNVFIFWIHFFLSVQRTVIAQMIPVSITYQFCKNKFVSKMIIYVNFNFVIMLTIIMMIMSVCVLHSDIFSTARVCVENVIQEWKTFTFS